MKHQKNVLKVLKKTYFTYVFKGNTLNDYKVLDHLNIISTKKKKGSFILI